MNVLVIGFFLVGCSLSVDVKQPPISLPSSDEDPPFEEGPYTYGNIPGGMLKANLSFGPGKVARMLSKPDGSLWLAGSFGSFDWSAPAVVKMNTDGSFDSNFGAEGRSSGPMGLSGSIYSLGFAVDSESRVYVASQTDSKQAIIYRFLPNGNLDSSFASGGTFISSESDSELQAVAVLPDDSIVAVGSIYNPNETASLYMIKLLEDGSLDSSFSGDGVVKSVSADSMGGGHVLIDTISGVPYIVLASYFDPSGPGSMTIQLSRWNLDGTLDASFGSNGEFVIPTTSMWWAKGLIRRNSGAYTLAGAIFEDGFESMIVQVTSVGALDTTFGGGTGKFIYDFGGSDEFSGLAELSDGRLVAVGVYSALEQVYVALLTSAGQLDTSFDGDGTYKSNLPDNKWQPVDVQVLTNDQIMIAGTYQVVTSGDQDSFLLKMSLTSGPVAGFGANGILDIAIANGQDSLNRSIVTKDGKFILLGQKGGFNGKNILIRLNKDYTADKSFADAGILDLGDIVNFNAIDVLEIQDGSLLLTGFNQGTGKGMLVALNTDGSLKTSFASGGVFVDSYSGSSFFARAVELKSGKIALTGFTSGADEELYVIRINADGSLDTTFADEGVFSYDLDFDGNLSSGFETEDGSLILGGVRINSDFEFSDLVIKLDSQGALDSGFANGGVFSRQNWDGNGGQVAKLLQAPDGNIIAASGGSFDGAGISIFRLSESGQLDISFGTNGYSSTQEGWDSGMITDIFLDDLGEGHYRINALGYADLLSGAGGFAIVQFTEDGTLNSTFGANGISFHDLSLNGGAGGNSLNFMRTSDGSVFVAGATAAPEDLFMIKVQ